MFPVYYILRCSKKKNRVITGETLKRFDGDLDLLFLILTSHEAPVHASEVTYSRK